MGIRPFLFAFAFAVISLAAIASFAYSESPLYAARQTLRGTEVAPSRASQQISQTAAAVSMQVPDTAASVPTSHTVTERFHEAWVAVKNMLALPFRFIAGIFSREAIPASAPTQTASLARQPSRPSRSPGVLGTTTVSTPAEVGAGGAVPTIVNNYVTNPVVERLVAVDSPVGVSQTDLETRLGSFKDDLLARVTMMWNTSFSGGLVDTTPVNLTTFAPSQRIDQLTNTRITNPTITGGSISGATVSGTLSGTFSGTVSSFGLSSIPWALVATDGSGNFLATSTPTAAIYIATSTSVASVFPYASTTALSATTLCLNGDTCRTTWPSAGAGAWPFTTGQTNFGQAVQSTSTSLWFTGSAGVMASSSSYFTNIDNNGFYKQYGDNILYSSSTNYMTSVGATSSAAWMSATATPMYSIAIGPGAYATTRAAGVNKNYGLAIGYNALSQATVGFNIAIGANAMKSQTTGIWNTVVGDSSLQNSTTGQENTVFGYGSLGALTTGAENVVVGGEAAVRNITGRYNTAMGTYSLYYNQSATNTVAIGYSAGGGLANHYNQGGVYLGSQAGNSVGNNSDYNTLIGYQAGYDIATGGSYNIVLGTATTTGVGLTTGTNNILIGNGVNAGLTRAGSNQLNIGNLIFGTGLAASSTLSTGAIGIGTTTPGTTLTVEGSGIDNWGFYKQHGDNVLYASSTNKNIAIGATSSAAWMSTSATPRFSIGIGELALTGTPSGGSAISNTAVGYRAMTYNTTGGWNSAYGAIALKSNTGGSENSAFGVEALENNTTGNSNVAVGFMASIENITGSKNVTIGKWASYFNQSATSTVAIGYSAASGVSNYYNQGGVYLGSQAGNNAASGSDFNTLLGYQAGYNITTGYGNIVLGSASSTGAGITTGNNNILIGTNVSSGLSQTGSNQLNIGNLIFGSSLGASSTLSTGRLGIGTTTSDANGNGLGMLAIQTQGSTGNYTATTSGIMIYGQNGGELMRIFASDPNEANFNTANLYVGYKAGMNNPTANTSGSGWYNTAIGSQAGLNITGGDRNTALGWTALQSNTSGFRNTAIGAAAMNSIVDGAYNTGIGQNALWYATSSYNMVALGYQAGVGTANYSNLGSTYIGDSAGRSAQSNSNYNTFLGYQAGYDVTTGTQNIVIGPQAAAGTGLTTGYNNILLGYDVRSGLTRTGSNQLNIGNLIFGTGLATSSTLSTGNIGIGSTTPDQMLTVNGNVNIAAGKCYMINGVCIGYVVKLAAIYATSTPGSNARVVFTGAQDAAPSFSNGTLTLASNTSHFVAEVWGAGGGGGSAGAQVGGSGGGGGGYSRKMYSSPVATQYFYNVGTGGTAGSGGGAGGAGGNSSFGTGSATTTANGGGAGSGNGGAAGTGGTASSGDLTQTGGAGMIGLSATVGGPGGSAAGAGGQGGTSSSGSGNAGEVLGGGGGGSGSGSGGVGGAGGIVLTTYATSSPNAAGNDYAELFPVSNPLVTAGDIVAVDNGIPVNMRLARKGDKMLVGIISTQPGQLLGDKDAVGMRPVALAGRVPTKVTMENGPIALGDRIAISSTPGVGMKAGTFDDAVGIALESADQDGSILVFVTLSRGIDINAIAISLLGNDPALIATLTSASTSTTTAGAAGPIDFVGGMMSAFASRIGLIDEVSATTTSTTTSSEVTHSDPFAYSFLHGIFAHLVQWFADAGNGIETLFAKTFTGNQLCLKDEGGTSCYTRSKLDAMFAAGAQGSSAPSLPTATSSTPDTSTDPVLPPPPVIEIQGADPAIIHVGDVYADLGATITGPAESLNLGLAVFLNGALVDPQTFSFDTSTTSTSTIEYVATDSFGQTATATRLVIVQ